MSKTTVKRPLYLNKILPFVDKPLIKVLVGQRRVGKSMLLLQIIDWIRSQDTSADILYINKEDYAFDAIRDYHDLLQYIEQHENKQGKSYIFIDEIQDIEQFEKALRSLYAHEKYDIYCTGSNAHLLSGELATYLSGRHIEITVHALSYQEFLTFHNLDNSSDALLRYIKYGGLPFLINLSNEDSIIYEYLSNVYNTILFKDIIKRHQIRSSHLLERLIDYLCDNLGSLVSAKKISDFLKSQRNNTSPNVILDYLSHLSNAFLVSKAQRYDIKGKKLFEVNDKYYFEDLGLRHAIIGYRQTDIQKILENLVYNQLRISGYHVTVGQLGPLEIDFVAQKSDETLYVQVAYLLTNQNTIDREFGNLLKIPDNHRKIVVSMDEMAGGNVNGIEHLDVKSFLLTL